MDDVVQVILAAGSSVGASGYVYYIASGRATSVLEMIEALAQLLGVRAQLELMPFDADRLKAVALRLRELFPAKDRSRLERAVSDPFVDRLVAEVTAGFKGDVGVVPRQFLREFVTQMDLVEENADYDPMKEYGFKMPDPPTLRAEEQHALTGAALTAPDLEDDELVPQQDAW